MFIRITDTLALVGFGFLERADAGGDFTDELFVNAGNQELGGIRDLDLDAVGNHVNDVVGVAQAESELLPGENGLVADADDLELFFVAFAHADDIVLDQTADQAVERLVVSFIGNAADFDFIAFDCSGDGFRKGEAHFAELAFDDDVLAADGDFDSRRNGEKGECQRRGVSLSPL